MWELDCKESWALKNWCFWTVVLEKTLESPLDCKEIQPVHFKRDQSWVFFGRTDGKAETPIIWPPHVKSWLIGKDPDARRDQGQEEKGPTEDEMVGWHHRLDGHEFGWTLGVGDGQGSLACCDWWGCKNSDMAEWLNWTELILLYREGNGNPLQYCCLENPMDRGARQATVYGVAEGRTWLSDLTSYFFTKSNDPLFSPCISLCYLSLVAEMTQTFISYPIFFIDLWLGQCKQNGDGLLGTAGNRSAERQQPASLLPMTNSSTQGYSSPHVPWDLDAHIR